MTDDQPQPQPQPIPPRSWYNLPGHFGELMATPQGRGQLWLYASVVIAALTAVAFIDHFVWSARDVTPDHLRMGWDEIAANREAPAIAAQMPKFSVRDAEGNVLDGTGKSAELWKFGKLSNGGKHIATWRQESGDCVSMGWSNAVAYLMAVQIAREQRNEVLKIPFPPYMYGVSRVLIGKRQLGRGAGSIGAWAAQGSIAYGVLPIDKAESLGFKYTGGLADQWGWNGPPEATTKFAKDFRIKTVSQVKSWEDCRDALVFGYPVTVASNVGFDGGSYDQGGKRFLRPRGSWGHQMCFIGCDDRPGQPKGCYCINSWGSDWGPKPLNDEPPGGFWVDAQTVQRMVGQGDSWAYSNFDGFQAEETASWDAFSTDAIELANDIGDEDLKAAVVAAETPEPRPIIEVKEIRKSWAFSIGWLGVAGTIAAGVWGLRQKYASRSVSV